MFAEPHSRPILILRFLFILALLIGGALLAAFAVVRAAEPITNTVDLENARSGARGAYLLVYLVGLGFFCSRVGYRWFDTFLGVIPFYGLFFASKIVWRFANLPHRYWEMGSSYASTLSASSAAPALVTPTSSDILSTAETMPDPPRQVKPRPARSIRVVVIVLALASVGLPTLSIVAARNNWIAGITGTLYTERQVDRMTAAASREGYQDGHAIGYSLGRSAGHDEGKEEAITELRGTWQEAAQRGCENVFTNLSTDRVVSFYDWQSEADTADYQSRAGCIGWRAIGGDSPP